MWFGGESAEEQQSRDEEIRERFGPLLERAAAGELDAGPTARADV